jgi:biopolymer transport protein ExbB
MFSKLRAGGPYATLNDLSAGIEGALICAAAGIAVAIPVHAGYNYLVSRVNKIVLDMERAAAEIVTVVTENINNQ